MIAPLLGQQLHPPRGFDQSPRAGRTHRDHPTSDFEEPLALLLWLNPS
jgi:hypothetical protein